jgi:surface antigen
LPEEERPGYQAPQEEQTSVSSGDGFAQPTVDAGFAFASVGNRYDYGYCTWYVYERRAAIGKPIGSFWGNATSWASFAASAGVTVNNTPAPGAIFQSSGGYGHVAFVESVAPNGDVTLSEMNYAGWNVTSSRTLSASQAAAYNYIH